MSYRARATTVRKTTRAINKPGHLTISLRTDPPGTITQLAEKRASVRLPKRSRAYLHGSGVRRDGPAERSASQRKWSGRRRGHRKSRTVPTFEGQPPRTPTMRADVVPHHARMHAIPFVRGLVAWSCIAKSWCEERGTKPTEPSAH